MTDTATLAATIDHTILRSDASADDVRRLCSEAERLGCAAVCISPNHVAAARAVLNGSVLLATVAGFPSGAHLSAVVADEARRAADEGADEVDMVIDLSQAVAGAWGDVERSVTVVRAALPTHVSLKVILETACIGLDRIPAACAACERAGAQFVKTSTGVHAAGGATVEAVRALADAVGGRLGVKAAGGIRTRAIAEAMLAAGATRLGASATAAILAE